MIRNATFDDASAIAAIHVHTWQAAYAGILPTDYLANLSLQKRTDFWRQQLTVSGSLVLVAVENDEVIGWASGGANRDPSANSGAEVYAIYVLPEFWTRGIGRELMQKTEESFSPNSCITLWVLAQNQRAIRFYNKLGYKSDDCKKTIQLGGVSLVEIRLKKIRGQPVEE